MNTYTKQDLTIMQAWPLERKIQVTQAKILEWYVRHEGRVAVSFSGGKDSSVLLDLARRVAPDIGAVYVSTGLEYPELEDFVRTIDNVEWMRPAMPFNQVIKQYGYPVISKEVSKRIYYARKGSAWAQMHLAGLMKDGTPSKFNERFMKWAYLVEDAPFPISSQCCDVMKMRPLHQYHKRTGNAAIVGTMACESMRRQTAYLKTGCNAFHNGKSQPLGFWLERDILEYLRITGIPYASIYGDIVEQDGKLVTTGIRRSGCMWCMYGVHLEKQPNRFQKMEITHPGLHNYCINKLGCGEVLDFLGVPYRN